MEIAKKTNNIFKLVLLTDEDRVYMHVKSVWYNINFVAFQRSVRMWSSGEEHVRVLAFLGIRNVATMMPSSLLEFSVKVCF